MMKEDTGYDADMSTMTMYVTPRERKQKVNNSDRVSLCQFWHGMSHKEESNKCSQGKKHVIQTDILQPEKSKINFVKYERK